MSFSPDYGNAAGTNLPPPPPIRSVDEALAQIDRILHQMLMLAELSASDGNVDRQNLQHVLEHLQNKIDCIADRLEAMEK